jgi:hypothetical protein
MLAEKHRHRFPPFETLPVTAQCRVMKALTLLSDSAFYAHSFGAKEDPGRYALRIADLLLSGVIRPDCQWLLLAGYIAPLRSTCRDNHHRANGRSKSELDERTFVTISEAGKAKLACAHAAGSFVAPLADDHECHDRKAAAPLIHYDSDARELLIGDLAFLELRTIARNMERIVLAFEKDRWQKPQVISRFRNVATLKRAHMVRDAVSRLNENQHPRRIRFRSRDKGKWISYRIIDNPERPPACPAEFHAGS